ncbi:MAG: rhomboid family intramembrane serine protease [Bacteroidota bacterium]
MTFKVSFVLLIITIVTSIMAWNNAILMKKWIFNPYIIARNKQYYRFLTSGFIHNDTMHIFFNMFVFFMFGSTLEAKYMGFFGITMGKVAFVGLYLLGIIISSIPTFIKYIDLPHYNSLGASGGTASVLFSAIMLDPADNLYLFGFIGAPGIILGALYMIYSYYMGKRGEDNINHDAHLFGAAFGIVYTVLVYPSSIGQFFDKLLTMKMPGFF